MVNADAIEALLVPARTNGKNVLTAATPPIPVELGAEPEGDDVVTPFKLLSNESTCSLTVLVVVLDPDGPGVVVDLIGFEVSINVCGALNPKW